MHTGTCTYDVSLSRELKKTPVVCSTQTWSDLSSQIGKKCSTAGLAPHPAKEMAAPVDTERFRPVFNNI